MIANDVTPIEIVVWLPALCRKMGVPFCIIKNKARLGALVHQKNATCLAITAVEKEDQAGLVKLADMCTEQFNKNDEVLKKWGGGIMGLRTQARLAKREAVLAAERARKAALLM
jgi:large subunit ribosomal protein L7Ae